MRQSIPAEHDCDRHLLRRRIGARGEIRDRPDQEEQAEDLARTNQDHSVIVTDRCAANRGTATSLRSP
jgi:hypothetical protein